MDGTQLDTRLDTELDTKLDPKLGARLDTELIDDCVHCGFCLPACPTYQSWSEEPDSPRGRIYQLKQLAAAPGAEVSPAVLRQFDNCLGCMACTTACPSGVKYDALLEQARPLLEQRGHRTWHDRLFRALLFALFPYPRRLRLLLRLQLLWQRSGLQQLLRRSGLVARLPLRLRQLEALAPEVDAAHLSARLAPRTEACAPQRARVALLPGCVQQVYFPRVNEATVRVLAAEGCLVLVAETGCCGALSGHAGRHGEAQRFARAAIARLEALAVDAVVVNSAGCGSAMKEWHRLLQHDPAWAERARALSAKVRDVSELLVELGPRAQRHPLPLRAAYHDACHLAHAQRIRAQPRQLLRGIPGLELLEIPDGDQCCGSAGIYNLVQPESAREIGLRKIDALLSVQPRLLVSANPGCTLHLQALLRERGLRLGAAHPIELLDASLSPGLKR
jgi:glycolate oxidase iron-sulfur subunit